MATTEEKIYLAVLIAVSFFAVVLIFFILNLLYNQKRIRKLQRSLISAEVTTLENERQRISYDVHDELAPTLSVTLSLVDSMIVAEDDRERQIMAVKILKGSIQQIRSITRNMTPRSVEKGLIYLLDELVFKFRAAHENKVRLISEFGMVPDTLPPDKILHIYRIVQESMNNAFRHSEAKEIRVHVSVMGNNLLVVVSDNGKGFSYSLNDLAHRQEPSGIGLRNIYSRVMILGGKLTIQSRPTLGTKLIAELPL